MCVFKIENIFKSTHYGENSYLTTNAGQIFEAPYSHIYSLSVPILSNCCTSESRLTPPIARDQKPPA